MTRDEAKRFFAELRATVPCLSEESLRADGIVIVTDEMRAEQERKKAEALRRFGPKRKKKGKKGA